jgi:hypothetical protein
MALVTSLTLVIAICVQPIVLQTEGDTGYDYNDAYDDGFYDESALALGPTFDVEKVNVTVVVGQTALLPCSIDYLSNHKVAWLDQNSFPLTYEDRRVIDDSRFSLVRPHVKEWNLQIREVKLDDDGEYRCTVNTDPIRHKIISLYVRVPPSVVDDSSSNEVIIHEGSNVTLSCLGVGVPQPMITWYKYHNDVRHLCNLVNLAANSKSHSVHNRPVIWRGEKLVLRNISRYCGDDYECEVDNGVPPAARRQITVTVEFPPQITMPARRLSQAQGRETILECRITAYPHAANYWQKDGRRVVSSNKHRIEAYDDGDNQLTLSLRISDIDMTDYGKYQCVAANPLGRDQQTIQLFEYVPTADTEPLRVETPSVIGHSVELTRSAGVFPSSPSQKTSTDHRNNNNNSDHLPMNQIGAAINTAEMTTRRKYADLLLLSSSCITITALLIASNNVAFLPN